MSVESSSVRAGTFRGAWRHRRWRAMLASYSISLLGDFVYSVALVVFVLDRTGSAAWVSAVAIARLVPYVVLGPPAGVLADRMDRRTLLVLANLASAALLLGLTLVAALDAPVIVAVVLAALASSVAVPARAAAAAATPNLVDEDDLAAANAAESIVAQAAWFVGPAVGAAVIALSGTVWAFAIDAGTFVVAALLVSFTGDLGGGARNATDIESAESVDGSEPERSGMVADLREGVDAVRGDKGLSALVVFVCILMFGFGMEQVLHVLVAVDKLGAGAEWVGVMGAAVGIGGLVVAPATARLARSGRTGIALVVSGVMSGVPLAGLALFDSRSVVLALLAVEGAAVIVNEVLLMTLLQRATPDHLLARVFGLQDSATAVTQLVGSLIVPFVVTAAGLSTALVLGGGVTVAGSLLLAPALIALGARGDAERAALAPLVDELRRAALFADLGDAAVESIARGAVVEHRRAGEVVIAQGDPADDLYLVRTGELAVRFRDGTGGDEREVNQMVAGDWFGEIGLLERRERTATVATTSTVELVRIPGGVFLDALSAPELLPDPVRRTVAVRLARTHPAGS